MLAQGFLALLSHWRRHRLQLAMLLLGLALATALWSAVQAINGEARASYARAAAVVGQDRLEQLVRADGMRLPQSDYIALRKAGWLVSPVIEGEKRFDGERLRILGIDPVTLPREAAQVDVGAEDIGLSRFITPPGLFIVSRETADRLAGAATPPLSISEALPSGTVLTDIGIAQDLLDAPGQLSRLLIDPRQPTAAKPLAEVAPHLVRRAPVAESDLSRLTDSFHLNLTAFGLLAFAVGLFIVHSAIGLAFEQRRPVIRTLRAVGLPLRTLIGLMVAELLVLSTVAGLIGVALGYGVAALLLPDVAASLRGLYGAEVPGTLSIRPSVWGLGLAIAVAGTLASAASRLWRIAAMPLLAPARPRAWSLASERSLRLQAAAGLALLAAAWLIVGFGAGLVAGFTALGAMLLGAALILPLLLSVLLKLAAALSKGVVAQWFWADTRQQLPGLSLALMALLLALAANAGVGTMVQSFRQTFVGWLDQRLPSELYVTTRSAAESLQVREWLRQRSDAVLPIWNAELRMFGQPVQVFGIADHATYRDHWPMLEAEPDAWDRIARGEGVLANEQLMRRAALRLGDTIPLEAGVSLPLVGVFSDYGNPKGQVIIGVDMLVKLFPDASRLRYAVRIAPDRAPQLAADLRRAFDLPLENVVNQATVKDFSLKIFERTFAVTAALNVLTLGVAGLAIFASLLTLSGMRLSQLAPAWAMGLALRRLALLEVLRSAALASFTMLAAVPVGLGLAWMLLAVINVEAFGWRLPMHLFPLDWLRLFLLAVASAVLAALLPALWLTRRRPADLVKVFANER
ncbi:ABC transporter permease [Aestuariivirga litoralis]|uniref:ABC transporter permease n=1 Tax=Aestuariivirga litoralis TaxID=2650924 RepID=A0A2W2ARK1_9HYPH|nr:ABC transporter permease [Aestuariivirga litoralis]PZF77965.1 ABC transporter permease [Aestuariivirga litoralis]